MDGAGVPVILITGPRRCGDLASASRRSGVRRVPAQAVRWRRCCSMRSSRRSGRGRVGRVDRRRRRSSSRRRAGRSRDARKRLRCGGRSSSSARQVLRDQRERRRSDQDGLFEKSPRMKAIKQMIEQVAATDVTVLIWGETGVGKDVVARAMHEGSSAGAPAPSSRSTAPPCRWNCSKASCSATSTAPSPAPTAPNPASLNRPTRAPSSSMRSGTCPAPLQVKLLHVLQDHELHGQGGARHEGRCPGSGGHQPGSAGPRSPRGSSARTSTTA